MIVGDSDAKVAALRRRTGAISYPSLATGTSMNSKLNIFVVATICAVAITFPIALSGLDSASQRPKHHHYRVIVLGTDGGVN